jgi:hypothetical protein
MLTNDGNRKKRFSRNLKSLLNSREDEEGEEEEEAFGDQKV